MNLTYSKQRKIDDAIVDLVSAIGEKCRGRVEVGDDDVIEFAGVDTGKWRHTSRHSKSADDTFSIFDEFRTLLPQLRKVKDALSKDEKDK